MPQLVSRRSALRAVCGCGLAIPLTGCVSGVGGIDRRRVELGTVDAIADERELRIDVSVAEPLVTASHPAAVRIATTNEGADRTVPNTQNYFGLTFAPYTEDRSDDPRGLILRHADVTDESDEPDDGDGRWSVTSPDGVGGVGHSPQPFPSGRTVTQEFRLLDDAAVGGYYQPGTYRFENELVFASDDGSEIVDRFVWGFSVVVRVDEAG